VPDVRPPAPVVNRRAVPGAGAWTRPDPADRAFRSGAIEARIAAAGARIADPGLRRLLEGTLANVLDTTVRLGGSDERPDTFVVTGDIDAMWLRDSTAQVWPYLASAPDDPDLDRLLRGVIARQAASVLLDPYANAFMADGLATPWHADEPAPAPGVHERKWEPDSLAAFFRLSAGYARETGSLRPFDASWLDAVLVALATLRSEQRLEGPSPYRFRRPGASALDTLPREGDVALTRSNGMVHGAFRPSDDACVLPLNVPVNLGLAAALEAVAPVIEAVGAPRAAVSARALAADIRVGVNVDGVVIGGGPPRWAYEVDGLGNRLEMDDANVPSLLSLPYLGACAADDAVYLETRRFSLSPANPWYASGRTGGGVGSPHTGPGFAWPIAVAMRGLTALDPRERRAACLELGATHAGTFLAHEAFHVDDPTRFTRPWFAWANALTGELLERAAGEGLLG
jgi:uncharacterized protein